MSQLTGQGIWSVELRFGDATEAADGAAAAEALGYTAVWVPDVGGDLFGPLSNLLDATSTMTIASGVLNLWFHPAAEVEEWWDALPEAQRARVMLGIGISHGPLIGEQWARPMAVMNEYLDALDAVGFPRERRCLAALGPKMLELARDRAAGAHPYLGTPEHTALARSILGDAGLFVEQGVVLESDADRARTIARDAVAHYATLPNYVNNWKQLGFTDDEISSGAERFIDAVFAWGDADAIAERVDAHFAAGADHVCIQVIGDLDMAARRVVWETLRR